MKKILHPFLILILFSCSSKLVTNAPSTYTIETKKSFDEAWEKVIDYVTKRGTAIRTIEKASGLIVTDEYSFLSSYTYEDKSGSLKNPDAYVVINKIRGGFGNVVKPDFVTGNFNIRVKQSTSGATITVNLVNLKGGIATGNTYSRRKYVYYKVKSTNVFEKELAEKINSL